MPKGNSYIYSFYLNPFLFNAGGKKGFFGVCRNDLKAEPFLKNFAPVLYITKKAGPAARFPPKFALNPAGKNLR